MTDIADLENRLSAAMDRIATGLNALGDAPQAASGDASAEIAALRAALDEERTANAQLEERIKALTAAADARAMGDAAGEVAAVTDAHQREIEAIRDAAAEERAAWAGLNQRLVRLRRSNKLMRSNTLALRQAAADMVVDPELINNSLQVELDAAIAAQELERAEADVIIKTLMPMVNGAATEDA
ncbi:hypothetical protein [Cognatishimia sp.]|uniref:hypothetical protein n=1 Tax=Cognatishimia sp. TaxID=2211648 RepID=UPI00351354F1